MSDKFTRIGAAEGDIWYATTVGGSKSAESMEDNIDAAMLAFIGQDITVGSVTSSGAETVIGQVTIAANSVNSNLIIIGFVNHTPANSGESATFKVRLGTAGTTADAQVGNSEVIQWPNIAGTTPRGTTGFCLKVTAGSDFTKTVQNYVSVTATNSSGSGQQSECRTLLVLGA